MLLEQHFSRQPVPDCSRKLLMTYPWMGSRPGWVGLCAAWSSGRRPFPQQESWNKMAFKVPINSNHSMIPSNNWTVRWIDYISNDTQIKPSHRLLSNPKTRYHSQMTQTQYSEFNVGAKHSLITPITFCQRNRERTASVSHHLRKVKIGQSNFPAFRHLLF